MLTCHQPKNTSDKAAYYNKSMTVPATYTRILSPCGPYSDNFFIYQDVVVGIGGQGTSDQTAVFAATLQGVKLWEYNIAEFAIINEYGEYWLSAYIIGVSYDGKIYLVGRIPGTFDMYVFCIKEGAQIWMHQISFPGTPTYLEWWGGRIYDEIADCFFIDYLVEIEGGNTYCFVARFEGETGSNTFTVQPSGIHPTSFNILAKKGGTLYLLSYALQDSEWKEAVTALNSSTGSVLWTTIIRSSDCDYVREFSMAATSDKCFVSFLEYYRGTAKRVKLLCLSASSGGILWSKNLGIDVPALALDLANEQIILGTYQGNPITVRKYTYDGLLLKQEIIENNYPSSMSLSTCANGYALFYDQWPDSKLVFLNQSLNVLGTLIISYTAASDSPDIVIDSNKILVLPREDYNFGNKWFILSPPLSTIDTKCAKYLTGAQTGTIITPKRIGG